MSSVTDFKQLMSISPIDGRYGSKMSVMQEIFSEYALIRLRLEIEVEYFLFLADFLPELSEIKPEQRVQISNLKRFTLKEAETIKHIEREINHDVKAVEIYLRGKFEELGLSK